MQCYTFYKNQNYIYVKSLKRLSYLSLFINENLARSSLHIRAIDLFSGLTQDGNFTYYHTESILSVKVCPYAL